MLSEVERLDPDDLSPPERLATAANTAQSVFTTNLGPVEAEATAAERDLFRRSIKSWLTAKDLVGRPRHRAGPGGVAGHGPAPGGRDQGARRTGLPA
ncbi:hypothetical protein [Lentzea terrae]|uniref:hypothetical protein n=1 Tax=Lentzea terrae TaxID=2200761 RepID=UPI0013007F7B|nr:hypothetical protein [Lentzea terrae]